MPNHRFAKHLGRTAIVAAVQGAAAAAGSAAIGTIIWWITHR